MLKFLLRVLLCISFAGVLVKSSEVDEKTKDEKREENFFIYSSASLDNIALPDKSENNPRSADKRFLGSLENICEGQEILVPLFRENQEPSVSSEISATRLRKKSRRRRTVSLERLSTHISFNSKKRSSEEDQGHKSEKTLNQELFREPISSSSEPRYFNVDFYFSVMGERLNVYNRMTQNFQSTIQVILNTYRFFNIDENTLCKKLIELKQEKNFYACTISALYKNWFILNRKALFEAQGPYEELLRLSGEDPWRYSFENLYGISLTVPSLIQASWMKNSYRSKYNCSWYHWDSNSIAQVITHMDIIFRRSISFEDIISYGFSQEESPSSIKEINIFYDKIKKWIHYTILSQAILKLREDFYDKLFSIAQELYNMGNFHSTFVFLEALSHRRLASLELASYEKFKRSELYTFVTFHGNFANYYQKLNSRDIKELTLPCLYLFIREPASFIAKLRFFNREEKINKQLFYKHLKNFSAHLTLYFKHVHKIPILEKYSELQKNIWSFLQSIQEEDYRKKFLDFLMRIHLDNEKTESDTPCTYVYPNSLKEWSYEELYLFLKHQGELHVYFDLLAYGIVTGKDLLDFLDESHLNLPEILPDKVKEVLKKCHTSSS